MPEEVELLLDVRRSCLMGTAVLAVSTADALFPCAPASWSKRLDVFGSLEAFRVDSKGFVRKRSVGFEGSGEMR